MLHTEFKSRRSSLMNELSVDSIPAAVLQKIENLEIKIDGLLKEKKQKDLQYDSLDAAFHSQKAKFDQLKESYNDISKNIARESEMTESLKHQLDKKNEELKQSNFRLSTLDSQLQNLNQKLKDEKSSANRSQKENEFIRNRPDDIERYENRIRELEAEIAESSAGVPRHSRSSNVNTAINFTNLSLNDPEDDLTRLRQENQQLKLELAQSESKFSSSLPPTSAGISRRSSTDASAVDFNLLKLQKDNDALRAKGSSLEMQLNRIENEKLVLHRRLTEKESAVKEMMSDHASMLKDKESLIGQLESQLNAMQTALRQRDRVATEKQQGTEQELRRTLQQSQAEWQNKLAEFSAATEKYEKESLDRERRITELTQQCAHLTSVIAKKEETFSDELHDIQEDVQNARTVILALNTTLKERDAEVKYLHEEHEKALDYIEEKEKEWTAAADQHTGRDQQCQDLLQQWEAEKAHHQATSQALEEKQLLCERVSEAHLALQVKLAQLSDDLSALQQEKEQMILLLDEHRLSQQVTTVQLNETEQRFIALQHHCEQLEDAQRQQAFSLRDAQQSVEEQEAILARKVKQLQEEKDALANQLEVTQHTLNVLEGKQRDQAHVQAQFEETHRVLQQQYEHLCEEKERALLASTTLSEKYQRLEEALAEVQNRTCVEQQTMAADKEAALTELLTALETSRAHVAVLEKERADHAIAADQLTERVASRDRRIDELEMSLRDGQSHANQDHHVWQTQRESLEQEITVLHQTLARQEEQWTVEKHQRTRDWEEQQTRLVEGLMRDLQESRDSDNEHQRTLTELTEQRDLWTEEKRALVSRCAQLVTEIDDQATQCARLVSTVETLQQDHESVARQLQEITLQEASLREALARERAHHETREREQSAATEGVQQETAQWRAQSVHYEETCERLTAQLQQKDELLQTQTLQLQQRDRQSEQHDERLRELTERLEGALQESEGLREQHKALAVQQTLHLQTLDLVQQQRGDLERAVSALTADKEALLSRVEAASAAHETLSTENRQLSDQVAHLTSAVSLLREQQEREQQRESDEQQERQRQRETDQQQQQEKMVFQLKEREEQIMLLTHQLENKTVMIQKMEFNLEVSEESLQDQVDAMERLKEAHDRLTEQTQQQTAQLEALQRHAERDAAQLRARTESEQQRAAERDQWMNELASLREQHEAVTEQLRGLTHDREVQQLLMARYERDLEDARLSAERDSRERTQAVKRDTEMQEHRVEAMTRQLEDSQHRVSEMAQQMADKEQQMTELHRTLEQQREMERVTKENAIKEMEVTLGEREAAMRRVQTEVQQLQQRLAEKEREIERLQQKGRVESTPTASVPTPVRGQRVGKPHPLSAGAYASSSQTAVSEGAMPSRPVQTVPLLGVSQASGASYAPSVLPSNGSVRPQGGLGTTAAAGVKKPSGLGSGAQGGDQCAQQ